MRSTIARPARSAGMPKPQSMGASEKGYPALTVSNGGYSGRSRTEPAASTTRSPPATPAHCGRPLCPPRPRSRRGLAQAAHRDGFPRSRRRATYRPRRQRKPRRISHSDQRHSMRCHSISTAGRMTSRHIRFADLHACLEKGDADFFRRNFEGKAVLLGPQLDFEDSKTTTNRVAPRRPAIGRTFVSYPYDAATPIVRNYIDGV